MGKHANLAAFAAEMYRKGAVLDREVGRVTRSAVLGIVQEVAQATPIDTGQAQSNWLTNVGGSIPYYRANELSNQGWLDSIDFAKNALAGLRGDEVIHITNNVPYIVKLNQGTSTQAPAMFVQLAIVRARYKIKGMSINLS